MGNKSKGEMDQAGKDKKSLQQRDLRLADDASSLKGERDQAGVYGVDLELENDQLNHYVHGLKGEQGDMRAKF